MKPPRTGLEAFLFRADTMFPPRHCFYLYPIMLDGKIIATNGHILVEWPSADMPIGETPPKIILEKIRSLFAVAVAEQNYVDLPLLPDFSPCSECNGDGRINDGTTCEGCDGYGECEKRIAVGSANFGIRYLRLLSSLPGIRLAPAGEEKMAAFKFNGGRGLLMPMKKHDVSTRPSGCGQQRTEA